MLLRGGAGEAAVEVVVFVQSSVWMAAGMDFAQGVDVDVGVDLGGFHPLVTEHLMLPSGRTSSRHVALLLSISLRSVPARSGCPHRRDAYPWRNCGATNGMIRVCRCRSVSGVS